MTRMQDDPIRAAAEELAITQRIRSLLSRYGRACDAGDLDAVRKLFASDAVVHSSATHRGLEEITDFYQQAFRARTTPVRHFITNVLVVADGEGRWDVDAYFMVASAAVPSEIHATGEYHDTVAVTDGTPLIVSKRIVMERS